MCGGSLSFSDICQDLWVLCRPVLDQEESVEAWVSICELALSFEGRLRLLHHEDVKTSFPCQVEGNILGKLRPGYIELHQAGHFALSHAVSGFVVSHLSLVVHFDVGAFRDCSFVRVLRQVAVIDAQDCARGTVVWTSAEGSDQRCSPMWLLHGPVSPYHRWSVLQIMLAARPADCSQGSSRGFLYPRIAKICNVVCFYTAPSFSLGLADGTSHYKYRSKKDAYRTRRCV